MGGRFSDCLFHKRFGSWNDSLKVAGIPIPFRRFIPNEELFANLENMWRKLGRQPRRQEFKSGFSQFSEGTYSKRFGSLRKACEAFIAFMNDSANSSDDNIIVDSALAVGTTARFPNLRLRFRILKRDDFRCCGCGRSPATHPGLDLHVDHKHPWSKGGQTVESNLQTLCSDCNYGKIDVIDATEPTKWVSPDSRVE